MEQLKLILKLTKLINSLFTQNVELRKKFYLLKRQNECLQKCLKNTLYGRVYLN